MSNVNAFGCGDIGHAAEVGSSVALQRKSELREGRLKVEQLQGYVCGVCTYVCMQYV